MEQESIIKKIKALMDKAASTDSIHEKESFMAKAQELLQKHNLEFSTVQSYEGGTSINEDSFSYEDLWERRLANCIACNNFCKVLTDPHNMKIIVIGKTENVSVVTYLISFYRNELLSLSQKNYLSFIEERRALNGNKKIKGEAGFKNRFIPDYLNGGVEGVKIALKEQKESAMKANVGLRDIILANDNAVQIYIDKKYNPRKGMDGGYRPTTGAYSKGLADGRNIQVRSGINGNGTVSAIKRIG